MRIHLHHVCSTSWRALFAAALVFFACASLLAAESNGWVADVRSCIHQHDLPGAARIVDQRLNAVPDDLEAQGWRARILGWSGNWSGAEAQYRAVLDKAPNDVDILIGLSDVLFWEGQLSEASSILKQAQELQPANNELAVRCSKIDAAIRDRHTSPATHILTKPAAKKRGTEPEATDTARYSASLNSETDLFSFTSPIQAQSVTFGVNWNSRWNSTLSGMSYRRFGQAAAELSGGLGYRVTRNDSLSFALGQGTHQQIAPLRQMSLDYDHGLKLHLGLLKGLELTAHSASVWFDGSQVIVLGGSAIAYLLRDWMWTFAANQARTDFYGTGSSWTPAASTRLSFPTWPRLRLDAGFGVGAENYSNIDQIGRISARTYSGGAHFRVNQLQDFSVFVAYQQRSRGQTQTSIGGGYGFHF